MQTPSTSMTTYTKLAYAIHAATMNLQSMCTFALPDAVVISQQLSRKMNLVARISLGRAHFVE